MSEIEGLDGAIAATNAAARALAPQQMAALLDDPLHAALIQAIRRYEEQIPRDTGALRLSLTRASDRAHVWEIDAQGGAVEASLGSSLPQAEYQASRMPPIAEEDVRAAVDAAVQDALVGLLAGGLL